MFEYSVNCFIIHNDEVSFNSLLIQQFYINVTIGLFTVKTSSSYSYDHLMNLSNAMLVIVLHQKMAILREIATKFII